VSRSPKRPEGFGNPFPRADGRWVVPYQIGPNKWKPITIPKREAVKNEREALEWAAGAVLQQRIDGTLSKPRRKSDGPTVSEQYEKWLKLRKDDAEISGATYDGNKSHFEVHIKKKFGDTPVGAFSETTTKAQLGEWIRLLKAAKGNDGKNTVKNIVASFRAFFDFVVSPEGGALLEENPLRAEWSKRLLPKRKRTDARFATLEDAPLAPGAIQTVIDNEKVPLIWRARLALVFTDPLRDGEIAGLKLKDVYRDAPIPYLDVNKACVLNHKDGFAKLGPVKKVWSNRRLPLHPAAHAAVSAWLEQGWEEFVGRPPTPEDPVFPRFDGEHARPDSAEEFRNALKTCELPDEIDGKALHFHDARGCVATWLKNAHVSDSLIRRFLGHAPVGAAEDKYFKGSLLVPLVEAHKSIPLTWGPKQGDEAVETATDPEGDAAKQGADEGAESDQRGATVDSKGSRGHDG
jgi:integrase